MKISIITAVYNNKEHIESCINSVKSQTYKNIEYIIIDGGSTDGTINNLELKTLAIGKRSKNEIENFIFISEPDNGMYEAINKGIKFATGDIIGLLHSDDLFYDEHVIEKIAGVFKEEEVDSVYSDLVYVYKDNPDKVLRYWKAGEFNYGLLKNGWMPPHPTFFVKKKIYDEFGGFDSSYKIAADYDLIMRFLAKHKISTAYLPEVTIKMRAGGKSNKSLNNIFRKSSEDYKALKQNDFPFPLYTLVCKNIRKLPQFLRR
jgi:glycosyltransferase